MSKVTDFPAGFVKKLCGERAGADTRAVGFHDAIYVTDFVGAYPQSGTCTGTDSIWWRYKRIRTEIDIQHCSLRTFTENVFSVTQQVVYFMFGINKTEFLHVFNALHPKFFRLFKIVKIGPSKCWKHLHVTFLVFCVFTIKITKVVGVGRSDTFTGRTHFVLAFCSLVCTVKDTVRRHDEVCFLRDVQTFFQWMSALLQFFCLSHEQIWSQNHTVPDDIHLSALEYTGRNGTQNVFLSFELQRVSCIRTSLETSHYVVVRCEHIYDLSFTFITPLETQQDIYFTCVHLLLCEFFTLPLSYCLAFLTWKDSLTAWADSIYI